MKKVLVIGATGAMGTYLMEKFAATDYQVDGVYQECAPESLFAPRVFAENLRYIPARDAKAPEFIKSILKSGYDGIVDFMTYNSIPFRKTFPLYLENTDHYLFFSSCRVFANEENPIRESSPRLLDVTTDEQLLFSDDYCMYKARSEDALRASKYKNWTIIRPSTTYSKTRCQLLTLERNILLPHMRSGKPVLLYEGARHIPASLTWAGDVAKMLYGILFNEKTLCEDYNVTSSESRTWEEIAGYYHELFGLNYEWVDELSYQRFRDPAFDPEKSLGAIWQLRYARLFNRAYDNSKMLAATGLKQSDFLTLYEGLKHERKTILEG